VTTPRSVAASLLAAALLLALSTSAALAAFQTVTLNVTAAPVGASVTMRVEISVRTGGFPRRVLYVVGQDAFNQSPRDLFCGQIAGATRVGDLSWQEATIQFEGQSYAGFVGGGVFTVPSLPLGAYYLAESIDSEHAGPGCHQFIVFEITSSSLPDTRMTPGQLMGTGGPVWVGSVGGLVIVACLGLLRGAAERTKRDYDRSRSERSEGAEGPPYD
jgi:hypothetical protein